MIAHFSGRMLFETNPRESATSLATFLTEVLVLFLLVTSAFEFFGEVMGVPSRIAAGMFALAWLRSAVREISHARRNPGDTRRAEGPGHVRTMALIVVGTIPWLIVGALLHDEGPWQSWNTAVMPSWFRFIAAVIALVGALTCGPTSETPASSHLFGKIGRDAYLLVAWLLTMSSSALVGLLAGGQLIVLLAYRYQRYQERHSADGTVEIYEFTNLRIYEFTN